MPTSVPTIPAKIISSHELTKNKGPAVTILKKSFTASPHSRHPITALYERDRRSAHHQHGPVGQVDYLVRGAAEEEPGQVTPAPRAHDDETDVVGLGVLDDLAGGVAVHRVPHHALRLAPALGQ